MIIDTLRKGNIYLRMFMLSFIYMIDSMWSFLMEVNLWSFLIVCLYMDCGWRSNHGGEGLDPIKLFNPSTCLCLSQARTWISNAIIMSCTFCIQWFEVISGCLLCCCWWNCWPSFQNFTAMVKKWVRGKRTTLILWLL